MGFSLLESRFLLPFFSTFTSSFPSSLSARLDYVCFSLTLHIIPKLRLL